MTEKQLHCKFCHQELVLKDGCYYEFYNQILLASGGWTALYIGVNKTGETVMRASGEDLTDNYYPKYCPECGRKLSDSDG